MAVDGRGASGKSTLANRLCAAVPACTVVSTDDVAWYHSFFGWAELIATGVLEPARRGESVSYRPPAWQERGRAGAIEVPAGRQLLLVEGVGAGRRELTDLLDAVVWVQSDFAEAERRDGRADDRDSQADQRDTDADRHAFLTSPTYGEDHPARRHAALDRSDSRGDRSDSASDRFRLARREGGAASMTSCSAGRKIR